MGIEKSKAGHGQVQLGDDKNKFRENERFSRLFLEPLGIDDGTEWLSPSR